MCVKCLNVCFLRLFIEDKVLLYLFLQIGIKSIYTLKVFHFLTISFAQGIMVKQISYPNELDRDDEIIHLNKGRNTFLSKKVIGSRYNQNSNQYIWMMICIFIKIIEIFTWITNDTNAESMIISKCNYICST